MISLALALQLSGPESPLRAYIEPELTRAHVPQMLCAVVAPDDSVATYEFTSQEPGLRKQHLPGRLFRVASLTKSMSAYVAYQMDESGEWSMTDPARRYIPELPEDWAEITLDHLVHNRSGVPSPASFDHHFNYPVSDFLDLLTAGPLAAVPGEEYQYSNFGYALLQIAMERRLHMPMRQVFRERFIRPLEAKQMVPYGGALTSQPLYSLLWDGENYVAGPLPRPDVLLAAGGMQADMESMVQYELELRHPRRLSKAVFQRQFQPYGGQPTGYGGGWVISEHQGMHEIQHEGETFGFESIHYRNVTSGYTLILFCTSNGGNLLDWARRMHAIIAPD